MDANDIGRMADRATNLFRLETLPVYDVGEEADDFAAWQRGTRILPALETDEWLQKIRNTTAAGACWSRVRILDYPLTDYSEFELYGYQANAAAGEHISVADRAWSPELANLRDDFWMFDDIVVRMVYDETGRFLYAEQPPSQARFHGIRSTAVRHSVPLPAFLAAHEPRLIA
jgi:hypothetical protein